MLRAIQEKTAKIGLTPNKYIEIEGNDYNLIDEFINYCYKEFKNFKQIDKKPKSFNFSNNIWVASSIKQIKNIENMFVYENILREVFIDSKNFLDISTKHLYEKTQVPYKRGMIFHGMPGCGKTSAIIALSSYLNMNIYNLNFSDIDDNKSLFKICRSIKKRSIVCIEDLDTASICQKRYVYKITYEDAISFLKKIYRAEFESMKDENIDLANILCDNKKEMKTNIQERFFIPHLNLKLSECSDKCQALCTYYEKNNKKKFLSYAKIEIKDSLKNSLTLDAILKVLDGNEYFNKCILIITTNILEKLDSAIIRSGRIESICEFLPANNELIYVMHKKLTGEDLSFVLPNDITITQSELIHQVYLKNKLKAEACETALEEIIKKKCLA